jgi:Ricin-type beta-trefoil lectin domain-like
MNERRWWQRTVAATCATGLAMGLALLGAHSASAGTADENAPAYQEPQFQSTGAATQVYSLGMNIDGSTPLVTVHGGSMNNGARVDLWQRTNSFNDHGGVLQANQLWEFVPKAGNTGGNTLESGWGWFRSRASGKCLQVMSASTAEAAEVNQWDCIDGADNELWRVTSNSYVPLVLQVKHSGAYLGLATQACGDLDASNGNTLVAWRAVSNCTSVTPRQENYSFATNKMGGGIDNAQYECLPGYSFRSRAVVIHEAVEVEYTQLGSRKPQTYLRDNSGSENQGSINSLWLAPLLKADGMRVSDPGFLTHAKLHVEYSVFASGVGQLMLFCTPGSIPIESLPDVDYSHPNVT